MRSKEIRPSRTKYYLAYDPATLIFALVYILSLTYGPPKLLEAMGYSNVPQIIRVSCKLIGIIGAIWEISMMQIVSIKENGISFHAPFQKRREIRWKDVCCYGDFYHYTYITIKKRFFYFSTKPLPGGVNYLNLTTMAKPTDTFLYVAEQRDVEAVIKQYYPKFRP